MNSWLKNILWLVFVIAIFIVMGFIASSKNNMVMGLPNIKIKGFEEQVFLTKEDVENKLIDQKLISKDGRYYQLNINKIESFLKQMHAIKNVNVFVNSGNDWEIKIELRRAIARIFNQDGSSCYLDKGGRLMPLSTNYTAHVLTINGYVNETDFTKNISDVINNDSLKTIEIIDDLYAISNYVCLDKFLVSQITHIYVNENKEFELIPRVGNQRILFGDATKIEGKFKKLNVFYKEGINNTGWENYDTINIKYTNQVVCSKR